jgi:hypothetical protein
MHCHFLHNKKVVNFSSGSLYLFVVATMAVVCVFETSVGTFSVELYNQHAPNTCHNFQGILYFHQFEAVFMQCTMEVFSSISTNTHHINTTHQK